MDLKEKLVDVAKEVGKDVDVQKVASAAMKDGKPNAKAAARELKSEVADSAKEKLADAAKGLMK